MARPRSRSPHYRMSPRRHEDVGGRSMRIPWDGPEFDPHRGDHGRMPFDGKHHLREDCRQPWGHHREGIQSDGHRRSPRSPGPHRPEHFHHPPPKDFHRRSPLFHPNEMDYAGHGISPPPALRHQDGGAGQDRGRSSFRDFENFEDRERPSVGPQRLPREKLPPEPFSHSNHQHRDSSSGWRRDEHSRGPKSARDGSPMLELDDRGRMEVRGREDVPTPYRQRRRDDPYPDSHRREMDDTIQAGYRREDASRERQRSLEKPRVGFEERPGERRGTQGGFPHRAGRSSETVIVEHDHGQRNNRGPPWWETTDERNPSHNNDRERHHHQKVPSYDRYRSSDRSDVREETRGRPAHHNRRTFDQEQRRSPTRQDSASSVGFAGRDGPLNHRGRNNPVTARSSRSPGPDVRMEIIPARKQMRLQQMPQGHKDHPVESQRLGYPPREKKWDAGFKQDEPRWAEDKSEFPRWKGDRPGSMDRGPPRDEMESGVLRRKDGNWNHPKNIHEMTVVTEETLTIKVDMNRPSNKKSQLCYSSDRQLSLDLVNVGRQRLDFLPMLEHSGTFQETATHTGTFAQEIIQLVHQVKEHYFKGEGITLNERFSSTQLGGLQREEEEVERPTLNRPFHVNVGAVPEPESLFSRLGHIEEPLRQEYVRDPGDLRHDLERRRQERLEGVKVTIMGGSMSQHPHGPGSEQNAAYEEDHPQGKAGHSSWSDESGRWTEGMRFKRGDSFRGTQRNKSKGPVDRLGNRSGPARRLNNRDNVDGANW